jgi:hypothetical protein
VRPANDATSRRTRPATVKSRLVPVSVAWLEQVGIAVPTGAPQAEGDREALPVRARREGGRPDAESPVLRHRSVGDDGGGISYFRRLSRRRTRAYL